MSCRCCHNQEDICNACHRCQCESCCHREPICYRCPEHKPEPKPEPKREPLLAQLINPDRQNLGPNDPFLFTAVQNVSTTDPNAPLYYNNIDGSITFNIPGRYIIVYNTVVWFDDVTPPLVERVVVQLNRNGNLVVGSDTLVREAALNITPSASTISRTTVVTVQHGDTIQLICRRNPDQGFDFFKLTTLVIQEA